MTEKKNKVIWYCHHYAGSPKLGMSFRPFFLNQTFNRMGHQAYIIKASFHHLMRQPALVQTSDIFLDDSEGVPAFSLKTRHYQGSGLGRLLNSLDYVRGIRKHHLDLMRKTGRPDVIIISSAHPFHFPFLCKFAREIRAKVIFEVRDLWPLSLHELVKLPKWHPMSIWLSWLEKQGYQKADYVVSLLDSALPYMQSKGLDSEKFKVIPNGVYVASSGERAFLSHHLKEKINYLKMKGNFLIGYAGAMGQPNALEYLIKAFNLIQNKNLPIHCLLLGEGHLKADLIQMVNSLELRNVSFFSSIPKAEVTDFLKHMDCLYIGWHDSPLYKFGVSPNKIYDYMLAQKPIVESGGAITSVVDSAHCGIRCEAENPIAIAHAIESMHRQNDSVREEMGARANGLVLEQYNYDNLAYDYEKLF